MPSTPFHVPGPVAVLYNGIPIGNTKAGAILRPRTNWTPVTDDRHGAEAASFIFAGKSMTVEVVGLDAVALQNSGAFDVTGGAFDVNVDRIGELAHNLGHVLRINERLAANFWVALCAVIVDPTPTALQTTVELQLPVTFLIVPDLNDQLFSTVPPYLQ